MYPMYSSNATPTVRSAQAQQRINDFASKIFTPYELQKLRTYIPGIKFVVEEAGLYKQNIVETSDLLKKLQGFVASVYIYDILGSLMRDINERVRRATDSSLLEVDRAEMAKLVNALRGFVATEKDPISSKADILAAAKKEYNDRKSAFIAQATKMALGGGASGIALADAATQFELSEGPEPPNVDAARHAGSRAKDANEKVYMHRIPPTTMAMITDLENLAAARAPEKEYPLPAAGMGSIGTMKKIRAFALRPENLPTYNLLLGGHASDDSVPAKLLQQLSSPMIDATRLAIKHRERLHALGVDDPPPINVDLLLAKQSKNRYAFDTPAKADELKIGGAGTVLPTIGDKTYADPFRLGGNPKSKFENAIYRFVKRDIIAFNRLRTSILNNIDQWWTNNGALNLINGDNHDPNDFYRTLLDADYRLSGVPQPACPSGSAQVYYDRDPSGMVPTRDVDGKITGYERDPIRARVVDPYIRAADGTWVENPEARVGPFCQKRKNIKDVMSGATEYMPTGPLPTFDHPGFASRHRHRRPAARPRKTTAGARRRRPAKRAPLASGSASVAGAPKKRRTTGTRRRPSAAKRTGVRRPAASAKRTAAKRTTRRKTAARRTSHASAPNMEDLESLACVDPSALKRAQWFTDASKRADLRLAKMIARRNERLEDKAVYVGKGQVMFAVFQDVRRPPLELTEDEKRVQADFEVRGIAALRGEPLYSTCSDTNPQRGWTRCATCRGIMPAHKTELVKSEGFYSVVWFYHHACYDAVLRAKHRNTITDTDFFAPLRPTSDVRDGAEEDGTAGPSASASAYRDSHDAVAAVVDPLRPEKWDLDRPEMDNYD
eukprot:jgi/Mesvir1/6719/Mv19962-RA.1